MEVCSSPPKVSTPHTPPPVVPNMWAAIIWWVRWNNDNDIQDHNISNSLNLPDIIFCYCHLHMVYYFCRFINYLITLHMKLKTRDENQP